MSCSAPRRARAPAAGKAQRRPGQAARKLVLPVLWLLSAAGTGCQPGAGAASPNHALPQAVDPVRLRSELRMSMDRSLAQVIGTASQVAAATEDRKVRQTCLYWKIHALDTYLEILAEEDPRLAFVHAWFGVVRLRQHLTEGAGKELFGPGHAKVVALLRRIEADLVELGRRTFPPAAIEVAKDDIEDAASQYRSDNPFAPQPLLEPERKADLQGILRSPLIPMGALEGTALAINRFTDAARDFATVIQHLPERTRWQSEVLLLEMEATGPVPVLVRQMADFDQELGDIADAVESLPKQSRAEFEQSLVALQKTQPEFQATLAQAGAVTEQIKTAVETARQSMIETRQTAQIAANASDQFTLAAKAFGATAVEVRGLLADYRQLVQSGGSPPGSPGGTSSRPADDPRPQAPGAAPASAPADAGAQAPSDVQQYRAAAESITAAAKEIRGVLSDVQQPLPTQGGIRQAAGEFHDVLDSFFWRGCMLAIVVFILALIYRWLVRNVPGLRPRPGTFKEKD